MNTFYEGVKYLLGSIVYVKEIPDPLKYYFC